MSELIPERRTDKNGVTSTRWVKPAEKTAAKNWAPPPTLNDIAVRKETIDKLANEMHDTVYGDDALDLESLRDIEASLSKYTDATLRKIRKFYADHSTGFRHHGGEHHVLASMVESGANGETAVDLMKYLVDDIAHDSIIAYSYYRQRGWIDWGIQGMDDPRLEALESTAGNIEKAVRLGKPPVAKRAGGAEELWDIPVIKDERLFHMVLDRIEDNGRIVDIIKSGKVDYDLIVAELDAPVQALSEGHL